MGAGRCRTPAGQRAGLIYCKKWGQDTAGRFDESALTLQCAAGPLIMGRGNIVRKRKEIGMWRGNTNNGMREHSVEAQ